MHSSRMHFLALLKEPVYAAFRLLRMHFECLQNTLNFKVNRIKKKRSDFIIIIYNETIFLLLDLLSFKLNIIRRYLLFFPIGNKECNFQ